MRVAISGASGTLGTRLKNELEARGDEVVVLVRREATKDNEREWNPEGGWIEGPGLVDVDAVVNLSGAPIAGKRWTKKYRDEILHSRLDSTNTIVDAIKEAKQEGKGPALLLSASAVGYYGPDTGELAVDEDTKRGKGFLAGVAHQWERAARRVEDLGVNVITLRTGIVLAPEGGMIPLLKLPAKAGLLGPMGKGRQWMSWITAEDHVRAMTHLLDAGMLYQAENIVDEGRKVKKKAAREDVVLNKKTLRGLEKRAEALSPESVLIHPVSGPVNMTAPRPVRGKNFMQSYAASLNRPAVIPFPTPVAGLVLSRTMVKETLGANQYVVPEVLEESGFMFHHPSLKSALDWLSLETMTQKDQ